MKIGKLPLAWTILMFFALAEAAALESPVAVRPTWGVLVENVLDSSSPAISPSFNFNFGAGVIMPFSPDSRLSFVPSADVYYYWAALNSKGRAVPADESQSSAFVLGLLLDTPVVYSFPLGTKFSIGLGLGLCLDMRVAFSTDQAKATDASSINQYLWDKGRFVMPSTVLRGEYQLTDNVAFGFKGRMLWPLYNMWASEGFGFFDHTMYLVDVAITINLGSKASSSASSPAQ